MGQPLYEYEAKFIKNLKATTGKDFQEWLSLIETSGLEERHAIRDWLQEAQGLDYMPAHKLSHLHREDQRLNAPKVFFFAKGRSGEVEYKSKSGSFKMDWEMGAFDVVAVIYPPSAERWEKVTNIPLSKRESVLHFIGRKVVKQEMCGSGSYEIRRGKDIIIKR